jgi:hypothetical protein
MRKLFIFAAAILTAASAFGAGEIYRWKDANGTWHYSDQPFPGAELVRGTQRPGVAPVSPPAEPAPSQMVATSDAPTLSPQVAQQVRTEANAAKAEQCKKAEDVYQNAVKARRVYRTDEKGNRVYLSEAEIDAARLEARANRDLACG